MQVDTAAVAAAAAAVAVAAAAVVAAAASAIFLTWFFSSMPWEISHNISRHLFHTGTRKQSPASFPETVFLS